MSRDDRARQRFERFSGPPMTLANMRLNGVRSLFVYCDAASHCASGRVGVMFVACRQVSSST